MTIHASPYVVRAADRANGTSKYTARQTAAMQWQVLVRSLPWAFQDREREQVFIEFCTKDLGLDTETAWDVMRWNA